MANDCGAILILESENPDKDINLYINSPGGSVSAGLAIYDTLRFIKPDVGQPVLPSGKYGCLLLAGGTSGKRFFSSFPNNDSSAARGLFRTS